MAPWATIATCAVVLAGPTLLVARGGWRFGEEDTAWLGIANLEAVTKPDLASLLLSNLSHFTLPHALLNLGALLLLGTLLERRIGPAWLLAGVGYAAVVAPVVQAVAAPLAVIAGASGMVAAMVGMALAADPRARTRLGLYGWLGFGLGLVAGATGPHVAAAAHVAGLVVGLMVGGLAMLVERRRWDGLRTPAIVLPLAVGCMLLVTGALEPVPTLALARADRSVEPVLERHRLAPLGDGRAASVDEAGCVRREQPVPAWRCHLSTTPAHASGWYVVAIRDDGELRVDAESSPTVQPATAAAVEAPVGQGGLGDGAFPTTGAKRR